MRVGRSGQAARNLAAASFPRFNCQSANAPPPLFFCGAGTPSFIPSPLAKPRGWSAKRRTSLPSCRAPVAKNAGASRRSIAVSLLRSWAGVTGPGSALPGTRLAPIPVQRAPRGGVIMPPGRFPGPPGSGGTNPARRRRTNRRFPAGPLRRGAASPALAPSWLHHRDVSRRRPQPSQARGRLQGQCGGNVDFIPRQKISAAAAHARRQRKIVSKAEPINLAKPEDSLFRNQCCDLSGACRSACEQKKPVSLAAALPYFFMLPLKSAMSFSVGKQLRSTIRSRSVSSMA